MPSTAPLDGFSFSTAPVASSVTNAAVPAGSNTTPYGCDARGSEIVCTTLSELGSMMLIEALCLFVTQIRPFGATATVRGAVPTLTSAIFAFVAALKTLALSLSWFTTQTRFPAARASHATLEDEFGCCAVSGRCTTCTNVCDTGRPRSSVAVTVT